MILETSRLYTPVGGCQTKNYRMMDARMWIWGKIEYLMLSFVVFIVLNEVIIR